MPIPISNERTDLSSLQIFCDFIDDSRFNFEKAITILDSNPVDLESLHAVLAIIQDVKTLAINEDVLPASKICSEIESIFVALINNQFAFIHLLSEVLLLTYDHLYDLINNILHPSENFNDQQTKNIITALEQISDADNSDLCNFAEEALQVLTSQFLILDENEKVSSLVSKNIENQNQADVTQLEIDRTLKSQQDLIFFKLLMNETSHRFPNVKQRSERILPLALEMNGIADNPVNPLQLEAAIYLHDVGMSFIPDEVLTKKENFSAADRESMQRHPTVIAEMLRRFDYWHEAAEIVQQHHERLDGSGYPGKLTKDQICDGAKIVAILDAFDAMTNIRSDRPFKKTILRAVREIATNNKQFDPDWADVFIQVIKIHFSK